MTIAQSLGVAVIGGGMAGRAHAAGYRTATTLFGTDRPEVRLVAIADTNTAVADDTAKRYGYERAEYDWQAIADASDIDAVSVVVANHLHREIVEGLLAAGKHVLCEKPLAGSLADAEAMVAAAERSDRVTAVGFTYRGRPPSSRSDANWTPARWGSRCISMGATGATTHWTRRRRSPGVIEADPAPGQSPMSAATCSTCRSSSADRSPKSAAPRSPP